MKDQSKTEHVLIQELEQSESERKRLDDVLRLDNEILANMQEGVILIRVDEGVIVYANLRFESMFGYDPGELVGKHVSIINAPGEKTSEDVANEIIISLNQAGVWYGEIHNIRKDGTSFWCYAHVSKFKHPQYGEVWISVHQDITERRHTEDLLRESEEKYRTFFHTNPDATFISTLDDGKIIAINEGYTRMFGYTETDVIGKTSFEFGIWMNPAERTLFVNKLKRDGKFENYEVLYRTKTGNILTTLLSTSVIILGGVQYAFSIAKDITERKRAEEDLRESEERFRLLSEAAFEAIAIHEEGVLLNANDQYFKMFGYEPDEAIGKEMISVTFAPEFLEFVQKQVTADSLESYEAIGIRKDGTRFPMELRARKMKYKGRIVRFGAIRDITERKKAEEALHDSEHLLKEAQKVAHIGHWELDPKIGTPIWSDEIFRIFGLDPKDNEPSFVNHETHLHPNDWPILNEAVAKASMDGAPFDIQFRIVQPSGEIKWMHALGTTIMDSKGVISKLFGTAQDITERKRAEEELRTSHLQLRVLAKRLQKIREEERTIIAREIHDEMGGDFPG